MIGDYVSNVYNSPKTAALVSTVTITDAANRSGEWVSMVLPVPAAIAAFVLTLVLIAKHIKGLKIQTLEEQNKKIEGENSKLTNQKLKIEIAEMKRKVESDGAN